MDRLLVLESWLEDAEVFKVGKHGEQDLVAHRGDLHLRQHQAQVLDRWSSAHAAVANKTGRLVVPLREKKIDRVLERAGDAMIILGRDEDIAVERADLSGPYFGVRLIVLPHYGRHRLVEEGKVEILFGHEVQLRLRSLFAGFVN